MGKMATNKPNMVSHADSKRKRQGKVSRLPEPVCGNGLHYLPWGEDVIYYDCGQQEPTCRCHRYKWVVVTK